MICVFVVAGAAKTNRNVENASVPSCFSCEIERSPKPKRNNGHPRQRRNVMICVFVVAGAAKTNRNVENAAAPSCFSV